LHLLEQVPGERFLVTSGFRRLQQSKIVALGIERHFSEILIDAIDAPARKRKRALFQQITASRHFSASDVLVAGDNPESQIAAGKSLGIRCVQTLRPGVLRSDLADFHVKRVARADRCHAGVVLNVHTMNVGCEGWCRIRQPRCQ
jgi:FMN phosphatase YigB (HAD superfamily)